MHKHVKYHNSIDFLGLPQLLDKFFVLFQEFLRSQDISIGLLAVTCSFIIITLSATRQLLIFINLFIKSIDPWKQRKFVSGI